MDITGIANQVVTEGIMQEVVALVCGLVTMVAFGFGIGARWSRTVSMRWILCCIVGMPGCDWSLDAQLVGRDLDMKGVLLRGS